MEQYTQSQELMILQAVLCITNTSDKRQEVTEASSEEASRSWVMKDTYTLFKVSELVLNEGVALYFHSALVLQYCGEKTDVGSQDSVE